MHALLLVGTIVCGVGDAQGPCLQGLGAFDHVLRGGVPYGSVTEVSCACCFLQASLAGQWAALPTNGPLFVPAHASARECSGHERSCMDERAGFSARIADLALSVLPGWARHWAAAESPFEPPGRTKLAVSGFAHADMWRGVVRQNSDMSSASPDGAAGTGKPRRQRGSGYRGRSYAGRTRQRCVY